MSRSAPTVVQHFCYSRQEASALAATLLAEQLEESLLDRNPASLVVSGGNTPKDCLRGLSTMPLAWDRVHVYLTDERCVDADSELSNARMLREQLLQGNARRATLHPLTEEGLADLCLPFSAVLVGMGTDGHFASIFPDLPNLRDALDTRSTARLLKISTAASPVARITMTLALLLQARQIVLLAFGEDKRKILTAPDELPIAALLKQTATPVTVVWAP